DFLPSFNCWNPIIGGVTNTELVWV
ncbi:hypothetical protein MRB53_034296, partial [Persea americana]